MQIIRATYNNRWAAIQSALVAAVNAVPEGPDRSTYVGKAHLVQGSIKRFIELVKVVKKEISDLANKIAT